MSLIAAPILSDLENFTPSTFLPEFPQLPADEVCPLAPISFNSCAQVEHLIMDALGQQNVAFLAQTLKEQGIQEPSFSELLKAASGFAKTDTQRDALKESLRHYLEIADFEERLALPQKELIRDDGTAFTTVTDPQGDSVNLIRRSLEKAIAAFPAHAAAFNELREEIGIARISRFGSAALVPGQCQIDPASDVSANQAGREVPASSADSAKGRGLLYDFGTLSLRVLGQWYEDAKSALMTGISMLVGFMAELQGTGKDVARPGQKSASDPRNALSFLSDLFDFEIVGEPPRYPPHWASFHHDWRNPVLHRLEIPTRKKTEGFPPVRLKKLFLNSHWTSGILRPTSGKILTFPGLCLLFLPRKHR